MVSAWFTLASVINIICSAFYMAADLSLFYVHSRFPFFLLCNVVFSQCKWTVVWNYSWHIWQDAAPYVVCEIRIKIEFFHVKIKAHSWFKNDFLITLRVFINLLIFLFQKILTLKTTFIFKLLVPRAIIQSWARKGNPTYMTGIWVTMPYSIFTIYSFASSCFFFVLPYLCLQKSFCLLTNNVFPTLVIVVD